MPLTLYENIAEISAGYLFSSLTFFFTNGVGLFVIFPKILIGGSVQCNLIVHCAQCNAYFADDSNVFFSHKNPQTLLETVNSELKNIIFWIHANKLSLNLQKTNYMILVIQLK